MSETNPSTNVPYTREMPLDDKRPKSLFSWITLPDYQKVEISPLKILRRIFHENIDDYYMNLAKLYFEFAEQSREFQCMQNHSDKMKETIKPFEQYQGPDPTPMVTAAEGMIDEASYNVTMFDKKVTRVAEKLDTLAKEMRDELQYRPPEELITNIRVRSEHHEALDQFTADYPRYNNNAPETRSGILKRLFDCYTRLRVTTYNEIDRAVRQVSDDFYVNYEITDFSQDSENSKLEELLHFNLEQITFLFGDVVKRIQLTARDTDVQSANILILLIDFINDYYSGKEIDPIDLERLDSIIKNNLSFGGLYRDDIVSIFYSLRDNLENNPRYKNDSGPKLT